MQVFAALAAMCGAIAISKVDFEYMQYEIEYLYTQGYNSEWEFAINFNTLICCVFLLLASGGTLLVEIILLIVLVVKKGNKVFVIVVSYQYQCI